MSKLAILGGKPVTKDLTGGRKVRMRPGLERKYLLQVHDSGAWDDWPEDPTMAAVFSREWAKFNGAKYCALLTNGTHTLQVALETLNIGFGDEVIVPGITWQATASVVCDVNAVPILVDVDPQTLCIDPEKVEQAITRRTRAIIPVHLYNRMADMDKLLRIARRHGLAVIEDAAHSHGSRWDGKGSGSLGDFGSFSFQHSKLMNSGEGGALLTSSEEYYWKVVSQRSCGREVKRGFKMHSGNYRMTSFQAAILRGQLAALKKNAPVFDSMNRALDRVVATAPGCRPLRRSPHQTRVSGYAYAFLYDKEEFDGLPGETFRRALARELGIFFGSPYTPLNHSDVYYPHTKRRHHLGREYLKAITPSRWVLPACEDLWRDRAVMCFWWHIYACPAARLHLLADAIAKIHEQRRELLKARVAL